MQNRFVALLVAVLVAAGAGVASAQERFGGLTGIVTDASGGVLPGATVTVTSKTTGASRSQVTSADGLYNVPDLDDGPDSPAGVELPPHRHPDGIAGPDEVAEDAVHRVLVEEASGILAVCANAADHRREVDDQLRASIGQDAPDAI